jgi:hypothetical protein
MTTCHIYAWWDKNSLEMERADNDFFFLPKKLKLNRHIVNGAFQRKENDEVNRSRFRKERQRRRMEHQVLILRSIELNF